MPLFGKPDEAEEHFKQATIRKEGVPVNERLRAELQAMRDELSIKGYEDHL